MSIARKHGLLNIQVKKKKESLVFYIILEPAGTFPKTDLYSTPHLQSLEQECSFMTPHSLFYSFFQITALRESKKGSMAGLCCIVIKPPSTHTQTHTHWCTKRWGGAVKLYHDRKG